MFGSGIALCRAGCRRSHANQRRWRKRRVDELVVWPVAATPDSRTILFIRCHCNGEFHGRTDAVRQILDTEGVLDGERKDVKGCCLPLSKSPMASCCLSPKSMPITVTSSAHSFCIQIK